MKEEMIRLIQEGLYQDNLDKLIDLSNKHLTQNPTLFFILGNLFRSLADEYDDQGITTERYEEITRLAPFLIKTLNEPSIENYNNLIIAFLG